MKDYELDEIEQKSLDFVTYWDAEQFMREDVPKLIDEVRRLRDIERVSMTRFTSIAYAQAYLI